MSEIKLKIEKGFENLGHWLYQNKIKSLAFILLFVVLLGLQIPKITIDTSWEGMLRANDPGRIVYNAFREQFGQDRIIIVGIKAPDIFTDSFMQTLKSIHEDLENEVPYVEEVNSLINARSTRGIGDVLHVDELFEGWPERKVDLSLLKKHVLGNPYYLNNIVSADGDVVAIVIETQAALANDSDDEDELLEGFDENITENEHKTDNSFFSEREMTKVVDAVTMVLERYRSPDLHIAFTGGPVIEDAFNRATKEDMLFLMGLTYLVIIFFLSVLFRRISGVILPFFVIVASIICTIGCISISGTPMTVMTTILPSFVAAVGIADAVHVLVIFFRHFQPGVSKEDAVAFALGHSGLPIVMTGATTAAGLLSFSYAELAAIGDLGIFSAVGVILALIFTIMLLPPLIALTPIKPKKKIIKKTLTSPMDRVLLAFATFSTTHPVKILIVCLALIIISVIGVLKLDFSHNMMKFFPDHMSIKGDTEFINENLRGIIPVEIIVDTKKENGIYDPEILNLIESVSKKLNEMKIADMKIGKIFSINDILKETNQALHANDSSYYTIPQDHDVIAQEFFLFENTGSDDLEKIVDSQFSKTRVTIKLYWVEIFTAEKILKTVVKEFEEAFAGKADITMTGMSGLMTRTVPAALISMRQSYIIAAVVITIMMIMLVGSVKIGLISMVPNLLPIFIVMAFMAYINIPLDFNGLMIGSIALGLVVDDTMHFMYNFRKYYHITGDSKEAIRETLLGTGRALLITSLVLSSGFFVTMFATLSNSVVFGFFTGLVILIALFADFVLAPALMVLLFRNSKEPALKQSRVTVKAEQQDIKN